MGAIESRAVRLAIAAALAAALVVAGGCGGEEEASGDALNVVLVVSDDQTYDSVPKMPWLSSQEEWSTVERAYANQPWCCPSRASILSGQWAHNHGVIGNSKYAKDFDDENTIATSLDDAGFETGLFGKYLNGFPWENGDDFVPPGWDEWLAFLNTNGAYYDYSLGVDGEVVDYTSQPDEYSTQVFADAAAEFVTDAPEPFYAMVTPYAPHEPATPAPGDRGAFDVDPVPEPPNYGVAAPDQPEFFRERGAPPFARTALAKRHAWAATLGVDRMVKQLYEAVDERGALDDTVFVYMSDNGFSFGSHNYAAKNCLYEECARVPMLIRMPGGKAETIDAPISNVDLAPTIAALAGADPPSDADGEDLSPQLLGEEPWPADRDLLLEVHSSKQGVPSGYGIVNSRWKYIENDTGETELYDLRADPYELDNLAGDPEHAEIEKDLAGRLDELAPADRGS